MGTWGNLGKVNCGSLDVTFSLLPTTVSKTKETEIYTEATGRIAYKSSTNFNFT